MPRPKNRRSSSRPRFIADIHASAPRIPAVSAAGSPATGTQQAPASRRVPVLGPLDWQTTLDSFRRIEPLARHRDGAPADGVLRMAFRSDGSYRAVAAAVHMEADEAVVSVVGTDDAG